MVPTSEVENPGYGENTTSEKQKRNRTKGWWEDGVTPERTESGSATHCVQQGASYKGVLTGPQLQC